MPKNETDGPKKITKGLVEKAEPEGPKKIIRDTEMKGFGVRVTPTARTFFLERRIRGGSKTPITITIGQYPQWTVEEARTEARRLSVEMDKGIDPRKKAQEVEKITLQRVFDEYLEARNLRDATRRNYGLSFKYLDWGHLQVDKITETMVAKKHIELGETRAPSLANSIMKLLSALISFAQVKYGEARIPKNPVRILAALKQWYPEKPRQGVIKRHELAAWFQALADYRARSNELAADYLTFVLLTGARRDESQRLAWRQVDFEGATVTFLETKTDPERTIPMTRHVRAMLERRQAHNAGSPWVFHSSRSKTGHLTYPHDALRQVNADATAILRKTNKTAQVKVSVHDLRRTYGTILESLEVSIYALKNLMGHTMKNDITGGHYVVMDIDRLREPAQRLEDTILRLAGVIDGNVLQFPKQA